LDGSRLLSIFLPQRHQGIVYFLDQYGIFILLALLIFAPGLLSPFFNAIIRFVYSLVGLI
jgi:Zn-dependent protease